MLRFSLITTPLLILLASPAHADLSADEVNQVRTACRDSFLARDAEAYLNAAARMISWGSVENAEWAREIELCLTFADAIDGADIEAAKVRAAALSNSDNLASIERETNLKETGLSIYLNRALEAGADLEALSRDIAADEGFVSSPSQDRDRLEVLLQEFVRPIPAEQAEKNLWAYRALARINPDIQMYWDRIARYERAIDAAQNQLERTAQRLQARLIRTTAAFDGSSWSRHPSSPRYQDIRNYVTLYLIESGAGEKSMELFVNYTSRDGWLFVQNASINIDGATSRLPINQWFRDNDTEIWEFGSVLGPSALSLARKISESDRSVIRFNGQQFYDDFVVSEADKKVMREMVAMWETLSGS